MPERFTPAWYCSLVAACLSPVSGLSASGPDVIYGEDNRKDLYQLSSQESRFKALAASTALLTSASSINESPWPGLKALSTQTLAEKNRVCASEPYASQPVGGWCTGFLVGPDLMATAGHCVTSEFRCSQTAVVFGYGMVRSNSNPQFVSEENIYRCAGIVAREYSPPRGLDFAVIRLDRTVKGRPSLSVRRSGTVSDTADLTIIGHPSGLPTKVAGGAAVRENHSSTYFVANTDSYGGNSGSPVFNKSGVVEGILVRGENDYVSQGSCMVSKRCSPGDCRGEDITRATAFARYIP